MLTLLMEKNVASNNVHYLLSSSEWELPGGGGVRGRTPQVQFAAPQIHNFYELGGRFNPPSWSQLSVYSCARAPTTLVPAKQYVKAG
jgi:hypothetical protein